MILFSPMGEGFLTRAFKPVLQAGRALAAMALLLSPSLALADGYGNQPTPTEEAPPMAPIPTDVVPTVAPAPASETEPFYGDHQGGITTPQQLYSRFVAFDLDATDRKQVIELLKVWTRAAARMTQGEPVEDPNQDLQKPAGDSADVLGTSPAHLTLTFGFGPGLFVKNGKDRYGLLGKRPAALADLPHFPGEQLQDATTGGDLSVQACANDPQVALHAVRELARLAEGTAHLLWAQDGFIPQAKPGDTHRNLMGFKDGTMNPDTNDPKAMDQFLWAGSEGPQWMQGGSYLVVRKIRIALEHWDRMTLGFQEQVVGRKKYSGAPLSGEKEHDPLDLDATGSDGNPVIPENSHARLSAPAANNGIQILRRAYSYDNNLTLTAERWPPWHQGMEMDSGLLFMCYQKDPRNGFTPLFDKLSKFDMMNQFLTHVGSGLFACPPGPKPGHYIGQELFE